LTAADANILATGPARRIVARQPLVELVEALPLGYRRHVACAWHAGEVPGDGHAIDVARAVRKDAHCGARTTNCAPVRLASSRSSLTIAPLPLTRRRLGRSKSMNGSATGGLTKTLPTFSPDVVDVLGPSS
jgi:hypothetical protein